MGQTHHKYRPQQLSNVIIRCNHMLKESMNISLGEGRRGGDLAVPALLSVCVP